MILSIHFKDGTKIYEKIRTVNVNKNELEYYREKHYAGEKHVLNRSTIDNACIIEYGQILRLI